MHASISRYEDSYSIITLRSCFAAVHTEYPDGRPQLWTDHDRYEPGDVLRANCSSPPSRPRVELSLTLNTMVVSIWSTQKHCASAEWVCSSTCGGVRVCVVSRHCGYMSTKCYRCAPCVCSQLLFNLAYRFSFVFLPTRLFLCRA